MILKLVRKFFHGVRPFLSEPGNAGSEWLVLIIAFGLFQCHTRSSFVGWVERSETHRDNCDMRWVSQGLNPPYALTRRVQVNGMADAFPCKQPLLNLSNNSTFKVSDNIIVD